MPVATERELLARYVADRSDQAFRGLVDYHLKLVFGCALRRTGNPGLAEEVAQNVFTILARKAPRLKVGSGLAGWLHKTTLYESSKALRGERRRDRKMKALAEHQQTQGADATDRDALLPMVDEAIDELPADDRRMILMHYFEGHSYREIGKAVGKSEGASQKQTSRALAKLEKILRGRGVGATTAGLASMLLAESAKAVPSGIAAGISGSAVAGASSLTASTLTINAIQTMTYAKTKIALVTAAAAAIPIGLQMNSIGELKREVSAYEQREIEYVEQGERLAKLEEKVAALPAHLRDQVGLQLPAAAGERSPGLARIGGSVARESGEPPGVAASGGASGGSRKRGASGDRDSTPEEPAAPEAAALGAIGSLDEMMDDPGMRKIIEKQMKVQLMATYEAFFDYLDLDQEKRRQLIDTLHDRQMAMTELGIEIANAQADGAAVDELDVDQLQSVSDQYEEKLKELMGDESYAEFDRYEKSTEERAQLEIFRESLEEKGHELSFETEQELMAIMFEENQSVESITATSALDHEDFLGGTISEEASRALVEDERATQERIRVRVAEILSPEQLEVFAGTQASHLRLLEAGVKMQSNLFDEGED